MCPTCVGGPSLFCQPHPRRRELSFPRRVASTYNAPARVLEPHLTLCHFQARKWRGRVPRPVASHRRVSMSERPAAFPLPQPIAHHLPTCKGRPRRRRSLPGPLLCRLPPVGATWKRHFAPRGRSSDQTLAKGPAFPAQFCLGRPTVQKVRMSVGAEWES